MGKFGKLLGNLFAINTLKALRPKPNKKGSTWWEERQTKQREREEQRKIENEPQEKLRSKVKSFAQEHPKEFAAQVDIARKLKRPIPKEKQGAVKEEHPLLQFTKKAATEGFREQSTERMKRQNDINKIKKDIMQTDIRNKRSREKLSDYLRGLKISEEERKYIDLFFMTRIWNLAENEEHFKSMVGDKAYNMFIDLKSQEESGEMLQNILNEQKELNMYLQRSKS